MIKSQQQRGVFALQALMALLVVFSAILFVRLGRVGFISDSEIWAVTIASHLSEDWRYPWVLSRPFFYGILGSAISGSTDSISVFSIVKSICILNGLLILSLVYRLGRAIAVHAGIVAQLIPWFAVFLLVTHSGFMNQGFRIRSDLFGCSFLLFALERTIRLEREGESASLRKRALIWLSWLLPLGATPKAIFQVLPGAVFYRCFRPLWAHFGRGAAHPRARPLRWGISFLVVIAMALLFPIYRGSFHYFVLSFSGGGHSPLDSYYFKAVGFRFLARLIAQNPIFFGVLAVRSAFLAMRLRSGLFANAAERELHLKFAVFCAADVLIAVLAPERYPFFLAALLAPLAVFAALSIEDAWALKEAMSPSYRKKVDQPFGIILTLALAALAIGAKSRSEIYMASDTDESQMTLVRYLESYLSRYPKADYYDVIGILPKRATRRFFAGPNDAVANEAAINSLESNPPGIIFYTSKGVFLEPRLGELLKKKYSSLTQGGYGLWYDLNPPIAISPENLPRLRAEIERVNASVGAPDSNQARLDILDPDGHHELRRVELDRLNQIEKKTARKKRSRKKDLQFAEVERVSPFMEFKDPPPLQIRDVFDFDGNY